MDSGPTKFETEAVFKRQRAIPTNKICFDCNSNNPTWSSITYGVFICIDCSAIHRSLGVHLSFVKSTQLDNNWTWLQLRSMQIGGNANARRFFHQHNCSSRDAQQKYNSRAAQLYREKLSKFAHQAMLTHGTNVNIDTGHQPATPEEKEVDFFEEHSSNVPSGELDDFNNHVGLPDINNGRFIDDSIGPNVDPALNGALESIPSKPRKCTIGQRRPASKLGAKKGGGLGAQRVKKDFDKIEKEAARSDQLKDNEKMAQPTKEEQQKSLASLQEAYENMGLNSKREEGRMKKFDPKKAEQAERLGMGLGAKSGISHSLFNEMKTIEQETPQTNKSSVSDFSSRYSSSSHRSSEIDDEFDTIVRFSTGPPKYKDSPFEDRGNFAGFPGRGSGIDDLLGENKRTSSPKSSSDSWENEFEKIEKPTISSDAISASANYKFNPVDDHEAQQKFGNAKSISSDMFFRDKDPDYELRSNLTRFEGSSSISSSDFFNNDPSSNRRSQNVHPHLTPDLDDVRESVRQGVTKVAGRLSNLATNVMSTIQDRYA